MWLKRHLRAVLLVSAGLSLTPAYLRAFSLIGPSEAPTLLLGDTAIVNEAAFSVRLPYSSVKLFRINSPKRGDMVQLRLPGGSNLGFKRVLGLPGETIQIEENRVIVNGVALSVSSLDRAHFGWVSEANRIGSSIMNEDGHWITYTPGKSQYRNYPEIRLAGDQYFLLGDNRDNSADSRMWGPVSEGLILGKVVAVFPTGARNK